MSPHPVPIKIWKRFLLSVGLIYMRSKGSHEIWDRPDQNLTRPVTFRSTKNEVPLAHIKTNLRTLGITLTEFLAAIKGL